MEVVQVYELVNDSLKEVTGLTAVLNEDLSNVVEVGTDLFNANAYEQYAHALVNRIGKSIFVTRKYSGELVKLMMDSWEFGSVLMKVDSDIPEVTENESWELEDGASFDPNIFYPDKSVHAKFYNRKVTFEIDRSITDRQIKQSFTSASEMGRFVSMLFTQIENAMTIATENLCKKGVASIIGDTIYDDYGTAGHGTKSGVKAVNLLKLYNDARGTTLTKTKAVDDKDFLIFASETIRKYIKRLATITTLFNIGKRKRFTPNNNLHIIMLSDFASKVVMYAQSSTFHNELIALPKYDEISYWQGTGTGYDFADVSKVKVKTGSGNDVEESYIVCAMFDKNAVAVNNYDKRVRTHYNEKAEFTNYFYKQEMQLAVDTNENAVVFFLA